MTTSGHPARPPAGARTADERGLISPRPRTAPSHIAIVSFGYPPINHVSGTRASNMAAHLVRLGYDVTVVTLDWRPDGPALLRETVEEGVRVIRIDPRAWFPAFDPNAPDFLADPLARSAFVRNVLRPFTWGPSPNWSKAAFERLRAAHDERPIDVVWAIHGSASCHEAAARLRRAAGVPWVADFKDPWNTRVASLRMLPHWFGTWYRLRSAAALTETCRAQGETDSAFGRPWHVVWSGYDADIMENARPRRISANFTLAYFGTINFNHDIGRFASILRQWKQQDGVSADEAGFHVFSRGGRDGIDEHLGLTGLLRYEAPVPRDEAFSRMKGADVLVLFPQTTFNGSRRLLGVKELEYFASGTPVLCVGKLLPELRETLGPLPQVVEAQDESAAVAMLREERVAFLEGRASTRRVACNHPSVVAHAWGAQAKRLASVLDAATKRAAHARIPHAFVDTG